MVVLSEAVSAADVDSDVVDVGSVVEVVAVVRLSEAVTEVFEVVSDTVLSVDDSIEASSPESVVTDVASEVTASEVVRGRSRRRVRSRLRSGGGGVRSRGGRRWSQTYSPRSWKNQSLQTSQWALKA